MLSAPRGYLQSVEITQTPAHVFMACTEPLMVTRWYGPEATIEPHTGGAYRVRLRDGRVRDALIDVWEPGRRLRLIFLPSWASYFRLSWREANRALMIRELAPIPWTV